MILELDFNSEKAIYIQIKEAIIKSIAQGEIKINDSLPSVRAMAEEIGVNLHTVNKAYNLLKEEGYLSIDRRKGAVVNNLPIIKSKENKESITKEIEYLVAQSYLKGIRKDEFIEICSLYYEKYGVNK